LDENDDDPRIFLRYYAAAIKRVFPNACDDIIALLNAPQLPPQEYLATKLVNELAALPEEFVLVLDDYHFIGEKAVHGLDLGALEPCLPGRLRTGDRRIELAPHELTNDVPRLLKKLEDSAYAAGGRDSLLLIGRRQVRSNNSWMHNFPRLMRGKDRCTLLMHPDDASRLGVAASERVCLVSRTGRIEVPLELSDEMMPGVVSLPHGWGHHRPGTRLATAGQHPGASLNDLTDDQRVDPLCGNAVLSGVPVRVEPVDGC